MHFLTPQHCTVHSWLSGRGRSRGNRLLLSFSDQPPLIPAQPLLRHMGLWVQWEHGCRHFVLPTAFSSTQLPCTLQRCLYFPRHWSSFPAPVLSQNTSQGAQPAHAKSCCISSQLCQPAGTAAVLNQRKLIPY